MSRLVATDIALPRGLFSFSGQARMDTFSFDLEEVPVDFDRYNDVAIHGLRMAMEAIRRHADEFPFWQRRDRPGRPGTDERTLLVAFMLQQLLDLTFREMEGVLGMAQLYYSIESVPDRSTICRKLSSRRRSTILDRFAKHILASLPRRQAVIATDATGYSGRKRGWNETSHHRRAREDWVKVHAVIEVDEFVVLAYTLSDSDVHESQEFRSVRARLLSNVQPVRSLAGAAYCSDTILAAAREHGAIPLHAFKMNARNFEESETLYQKLVNFVRY